MNPQLLVLGILWFHGCFWGMVGRFAMWVRKQQPEVATLKHWWYARLGSNLLAIMVGVLSTGFWLDGSLVKWAHLDGTASLYALAGVFGAVMTFFGHMIVSGIGKKVGAWVDANPEDPE